MEDTAEIREKRSAVRRRAYQRGYRQRLALRGCPEAPRIDAALSFALSRFAHNASTSSEAGGDDALKFIMKSALRILIDDGFDEAESKKTILRRLSLRER